MLQKVSNMGDKTLTQLVKARKNMMAEWQIVKKVAPHKGAEIVVEKTGFGEFEYLYTWFKLPNREVYFMEGNRAETQPFVDMLLKEVCYE